MTVTLAALRAELQTDQAALGYAGLLNGEITDWAALAAVINQPRPGIVVQRGVVPGYMVMGAVRGTDFDALNAGGKEYLRALLAPGLVDLDAIEVRAALAVLFPGGSSTRTNLLALVDRPGSRAELLWGRGTVVTVDELARAWRGEG